MSSNTHPSEDAMATLLAELQAEDHEPAPIDPRLDWVDGVVFALGVLVGVIGSVLWPLGWAHALGG